MPIPVRGRNGIAGVADRHRDRLLGVDVNPFILHPRGRGVAQELSEHDREIAETLAPELKRRGILLAGLDVIGSNLTEVNVTSPTGFQEIMKQKNFDVAAMFADAVEAWSKQ